MNVGPMVWGPWFGEEKALEDGGVDGLVPDFADSLDADERL
jgi:hypothetical protein